MLFFIVIFILVIMLIMLYYSDLKLRIQYKKTYDCNIITIHLSGLYGIIRYRIKLPPKDLLCKMQKYVAKLERRKIIKKEIKFIKPETIDEIIDVIQKYKQNYLLKKNAIFYILKKMSFHDLSLYIKYGLFDAYITGILYGFIYSVLIYIVTFIKAYCDLNLRKIDIKPIFNEYIFEMEFNCIITIKVGDIITGLKKFLKSSEGSDMDGTNYRRSYENNYGKY